MMTCKQTQMNIAKEKAIQAQKNMNKIILGFAGEIAAGKGTAAAYIEEGYEGRAYSYSGPLRDIAKRLYLEESRAHLQRLSTMLRENFHDNILSNVLFEDIKKDEKKVIAIDGVRRLADISNMQKLEGFKLVYVETDMRIRYERIVVRGQNSDDRGKSFAEFKQDHGREAETQIRGLKDKADFVVNNDGTFDDLYEQLDKIIKTIQT